MPEGDIDADRFGRLTGHEDQDHEAKHGKQHKLSRQSTFQQAGTLEFNQATLETSRSLGSFGRKKRSDALQTLNEGLESQKAKESTCSCRSDPHALGAVEKPYRYGSRH